MPEETRAESSLSNVFDSFFILLLECLGYVAGEERARLSAFLESTGLRKGARFASGLLGKGKLIPPGQIGLSCDTESLWSLPAGDLSRLTNCNLSATLEGGGDGH